jgi:hypothetical protein
VTLEPSLTGGADSVPAQSVPSATLLSRPQDGLPAMPAALLTLMGVSAAYTANKLVSTQEAATNSSAASQG